MSKKERQSNIELLRILSILGVIILHYIDNPGGILKSVETGSCNWYLVIMINSLCVCAVDLFVFISGYFMCTRESVSICKPIKLLLQVIIFNIGFNVLAVLVGRGDFSIKSIARCFLPTNYFVTLYVALYLISPFLNMMIQQMNKAEFKKWLILLLLLFSVQPIWVDVLEGVKGDALIGASTIGVLGAEWGYTIVTFVIIYFIASYFRLYVTDINISKSRICLLLVVFLLAVWKVIELKIGNSIGAEHYQNPLIILEAILIFIQFKNMNIQSKIINIVSKGCFTVFILHASFIPYLMIEDLQSKGSISLLAELLLKIVIIYLICNIVGVIYSAIESKLFEILETKIRFYTISIKESK